MHRHLRAVKPLHRFFIPCEDGRKPFFVVEVWRNSDEIRWASEALTKRTEREEMEACCIGYHAYMPNGKVSPEYGTVLFHLGGLHPAVVAHEFMHATMTYCRRWRINPLHHTKRWWDGEERAATMVGHFVAQFYQRLLKVRPKVRIGARCPAIKGAPYRK